MSSNPLILIDVHNILWRSHYATPGLSHKGFPTGAIYGFLRAVLNLREISPRLVFCWDHGVPGDPPKIYWRKEIYPEYKTNRKSDGDADYEAVQKQIPLLAEVISWLGYGSIGLPGWEADDCIGVLVHSYPGEILIHSTDEDLYQLLDREGRVKILKPGKKGKKFQEVTAIDVEQEYGIPIDRWVDYLAMGADTADGFTVKGMGPVTAKKLVMMGADPNLNFTSQWPEVQQQFSKWADSWPQVRKAALLAKVKVAVWAGPTIRIPEGQMWQGGRDEGLKRFTTFCADYAMGDYLAARRQFFK